MNRNLSLKKRFEHIIANYSDTMINFKTFPNTLSVTLERHEANFKFTWSYLNELIFSKYFNSFQLFLHYILLLPNN